MARRIITLIEGDGIGPEITAATLRVLEASGADLEFDRQPAGAAAEERHHHPVPEGTVRSLRDTGVGLKGPLVVDRSSPVVRVGATEVYPTANAALRGVSKAFANVRPARSFKGVPGRYAELDVDLVIVREVSEGIYIAREREVEPDGAEAVLLTTRTASRRIARLAFELARGRERRHVTAVHKANVLDKTDGLFLKSFYEVAQSYPDLISIDFMIDAAAANIVLDPTAFDVIVAPNQYGDILSDVAAAVVGGLGLVPGANYGERATLYEACHGAAPDIAGKGVANPIALILSAAMMLHDLDERRAAERIARGVERFLERGEGFTPDLSGSGTTAGVAERIVRLMESS